MENDGASDAEGRRAARGSRPASRRLSARLLGLIWLLVTLCFAGQSLAGGTASSPAWRLEDVAGKPISLHWPNETKAVVFLFVATECPISNSYAPEYKRLAAEFEPKRVLVRLIYPNADETSADIRKHMTDYGLTLPAWRDPHQDLVKAAGVRMTPEAAVFVPNKGFVYHGRIDNRYADLGVARPAATEHTLRDVLAAVLDGKPVPLTSAKSVGCSIAPLPK